MSTYYMWVKFKVICIGYLTDPYSNPLLEEEVTPAYVKGPVSHSWILNNIGRAWT